MKKKKKKRKKKVKIGLNSVWKRLEIGCCDGSWEGKWRMGSSKRVIKICWYEALETGFWNEFSPSGKLGNLLKVIILFCIFSLLTFFNVFLKRVKTFSSFYYLLFQILSASFFFLLFYPSVVSYLITLFTYLKLIRRLEVLPLPLYG